MSAIYSVSLADGVKLRQACESNSAQQICYKHTWGDTALDAQRKTIEDRKKRKWMGTGKLPKEGRIESIQTNDHMCI